MPAATPLPTPAQKSTPAPSTRARPGTALAAAATLTVKGRGPMTGYSRDQFGQAWADTDRNGCDQRNDVLRRDLSQLTIKADTHGCTVLTGVLRDPYTGATISFTRGVTTSSAVQIDHVVAEGNAWVTGAAQWSPATRQQFANDPLELLAISGPANEQKNEQKGDGDTATWLPANKSYRCQYVARQIAVKSRYHLAVTAAELAAIRAVLATCPLQALPVAAVIPLDTIDIAGPTRPPATTTQPTQPVRPIPAIPTTTAPPTPTSVPAQDDVYYTTAPQYDPLARRRCTSETPATAGNSTATTTAPPAKTDAPDGRARGHGGDAPGLGCCGYAGTKRYDNRSQLCCSLDPKRTDAAQMQIRHADLLLCSISGDRAGRVGAALVDQFRGPDSERAELLGNGVELFRPRYGAGTERRLDPRCVGPGTVRDGVWSLDLHSRRPLHPERLMAGIERLGTGPVCSRG